MSKLIISRKFAALSFRGIILRVVVAVAASVGSLFFASSLIGTAATTSTGTASRRSVVDVRGKVPQRCSRCPFAVRSYISQGSFNRNPLRHGKH